MTEQNQTPRTPELWSSREQETQREYSTGGSHGAQSGPTYTQPPQTGDQPGSGAAIASLILGIVGLFFAGIILGIIGLVMASKAKRAGYTGGIRTAGFVLSLLALILSSIIVVIVIAALVMLGLSFMAYL